MELTLLTIVVMLTYAFEIIFGLAGTIFMLLLMSAYFDTKVLVIYSVLPQISVAIIGLWLSPKTVNINFLVKMLLYAAFGSAIGLCIFYYLPSEIFRRLLAMAITAFGIYMILIPSGIKLRPKFARMMDAFAGLSQALFGISGPIAMTRLMATFNDKTIIRNYALAFFLSMNLIRASAYGFTHAYSTYIFKMMLVTAPFLILSLWYANRWHFKVRNDIFRIIVAWMILLGGVLMLLN